MLMAERERPLVDDLRRWDRGLQNRLRASEIPACQALAISASRGHLDVPVSPTHVFLMGAGERVLSIRLRYRKRFHSTTGPGQTSRSKLNGDVR